MNPTRMTSELDHLAIRLAGSSSRRDALKCLGALGLAAASGLAMPSLTTEAKGKRDGNTQPQTANRSAQAIDPTEKFHLIPVDVAFGDEFWTGTCGFAVVQQIQGEIKEAGVQQPDGTFVPKSATYRLTHTLVGPGQTLTWQDRGSNTDYVFNADGTLTVIAAGPAQRLTVPGAGTVLADIGRKQVIVTFDAAGNIAGEQVLWKAGPSGEDATAEDLAAVCTWLQG
jgi:hypothetical protein